MLGALVLSVATEAFVIRPLSRGPRLTMLVATIGLAQVFFGLNLLIPRGGELTGKAFPVPFDWHLTVETKARSFQNDFRGECPLVRGGRRLVALRDV